ncbi:hypothetical protein BCR35DRAFT_324580 [Leucosporidium creatinivorum]|uniref:RBR-type E3 ubiquitin transferase n=1 Tax=Leucosporidium creatinivorum TaxID=106004 RepID=A0A1Y2FRW2_9BASI|nr:hypothetical protein BCR35DRAFT_324580 [Leucosporidium creatinivorum]
MNEQQTDELLALSAIFEDGVSWKLLPPKDKGVEVRIKVEVDWEEEREVEVWDWEEVAEPLAAEEGGVEGLIKRVEGLDVKQKEKEGTEAEGRGKSRKRPRRRGARAGGKAPRSPTDAVSPSSPTPAPAPSSLTHPPSATPRSPPPRSPAPAPAPAPAPPPPSQHRTSSILTLSLTKSGVATPEGHRLVHLSSPPPPPTAPPPEEGKKEEKEKGPRLLRLRYLPPLELVVRLGEGYPVSEGPAVRVVDEVGWLGGERIKELERKLGEVWQPGDECLWMLHDLIANSSLLTTLSLTFPLVLHQSPSSSSSSCAPLSTSLLSHSSQTLSTTFSLTTFSCPLCLTTHKGSSCIRLTSCSHVFCTPCLSSYFTLLITEGLVRGVTCPDTECTRKRVRWEREWVGREGEGGRRPGEVGEEELVRVVGREMGDRWRVMGEKLRVESDPSISFCPRTTCLTAIPAPTDDPTTNLRLCPSCSFAFCQLCLHTWHGSHTPCSLPQSGAIVSAWLEGGEKEKEGLERRYGRGNVRRLVERWEEERANREWLEGATVACPGCRVSVEKSQGCSHMQCARCNTHFCFRCGSRISATEPYRHFSTPGLPCFNKLFDFRAGEEPPVEEWLGEILEEDVRQAEQGEGEWHGEGWNPFV